jgi:hypothetical protein
VVKVSACFKPTALACLAMFFSNISNDVDIFAINMVVFFNYTVVQTLFYLIEQSYPWAPLLWPFCRKLNSECSSSGKRLEIASYHLGIGPLAIAGLAGLGRGNKTF